MFILLSINGSHPVIADIEELLLSELPRIKNFSHAAVAHLPDFSSEDERTAAYSEVSRFLPNAVLVETVASQMLFIPLGNKIAVFRILGSGSASPTLSCPSSALTDTLQFVASSRDPRIGEDAFYQIHTKKKK